MPNESYNYNIVYEDIKNFIMYFYQQLFQLIYFIKDKVFFVSITIFFKKMQMLKFKNSNNNIKDDPYDPYNENQNTKSSSDKNEIIINIHNSINIYNYNYKKSDEFTNMELGKFNNIKTFQHYNVYHQKNYTYSPRFTQGKSKGQMFITKKYIHQEIYLTEDKKWGWFVDIENQII